jgi:protein-tyrosine phosphatase
MQRVAQDLYISGIEAAGDAERLASRGITAVLKLTHSDPPAPYPANVTVAAHPLIDGPQNDFQNFQTAVEALISFRKSGETVLVHCSAGSSRSGAITAAALAQTTNTSVESSLGRLKERKPDIDPHPALLEHARKSVR